MKNSRRSLVLNCESLQLGIGHGAFVYNFVEKCDSWGNKFPQEEYGSFGPTVKVHSLHPYARVQCSVVEKD